MSATLPLKSRNPDEFMGHPKGLYVLFFTEMWERFSYYGMRALLTLFLVAKVSEGGFGWTDGDSLALYGWYTMLVYLAAIPGGLIADRLLGQKRSIMVGGLLLCAGHGILAIPIEQTFYPALALIVAGVGMLKPNISTLVGGLYPEGDPRRDQGFTLFYIGINVGAFLSSIIVGWVGESIGWHYGFGLAGIGMLLGQTVFVLGQKYLRGVGEQVHDRSEKAKQILVPLTKVERDRVLVLLLSFFICIVFWGAFEQAGGLMTLYTKDKVERMIFGLEVPASVFQALNPLFIMIFGTVVATYWFNRRNHGKVASSLFKMAVGTIVMGLGFLFMVGASLQADSAGKAGLYWLVLAYLFHTIGELCASPVALSFITKLAPVRYASFMMGIYFAVSGLGNKVAGMLGEAAEGAGELAIFGGITAFCVVFGGLILLYRRPLEALTHGAEEREVVEH